MAPMAENEKCLGCGVCVHACPTGSLDLNLSKKQSEPPETTGDWVRSFFKDKETGAKYKNSTKK
jgi:Fe-S-cluster-containing hydrogenase component 2